jgi:hypothetical protein
LIKLAVNSANCEATEEKRTVKDRIVHKKILISMYNFKLLGSPRYSKRLHSKSDTADPIHAAMDYFNAKYDFSTGMETTDVEDPIIRV